MNKEMFKSRAVLLLLTFSFVFLTANGFSQDIDTAADAKPVNTVDFGFFVTDKSGGLVEGITKEDLVVRVNGSLVDDYSIYSSSPSPLLSVLAVDNSGSMRFLLGDIIDSAKAVVNGGNESDLTVLMRFIGRNNIKVAENFSADKTSLHYLLDGFYVEGGQTALVDAIYKGVELLDKQGSVDSSYRRSIIVISDGEDRDSSHTQKELVAFLREKNVQVIFVGLVDLLDNSPGFVSKSAKKKSKDFIDLVVRESGGFAVYPKKLSEFSKSALKIMPALREQRYLEIKASDTAKIEITLSKKALKKNYVIFSRKIE